MFALVGSFPEPSTFVEERREGPGVEFLVVTGILEGQSRCVPHGHVVRLVVEA